MRLPSSPATGDGSSSGHSWRPPPPDAAGSGPISSAQIALPIGVVDQPTQREGPEIT